MMVSPTTEIVDRRVNPGADFLFPGGGDGGLGPGRKLTTCDGQREEGQGSYGRQIPRHGKPDEIHQIIHAAQKCQRADAGFPSRPRNEP